MNGGARATRVTATGSLDASNNDIEICGFIVSPGTATTTVTLREGGAGGAIVWQGVFAANSSPVAFPSRFSIKNPHVTIAGAAAEATFFL